MVSDLIAELEQEAMLMRARNDRLERELEQLPLAIIARLERAGMIPAAAIVREVFVERKHD